MNILKFDIQKGIYVTELETFDSEFHSHPAIEIIHAKTGTFELQINNEVHNGLTFAVIDSNIEHQVSVTNAKITFLLVEYQDNAMKNILAKQDILLSQGFYLSKKSCEVSFLENLISRISLNETQNEYDSRILKIIEFLKTNSVSYFDLKEEIKNIVPLSYSRVSHLFKENIGISLKKYLVWCNLRNSIRNHLNDQEELMTSFLTNGFYDQPHFNKSYKNFIGTSPARNYK